MSRIVPFHKWIESYPDGLFGLAADLGVTPNAVRTWLKRKAYPKIDTLRVLSSMSKMSFEEIVRDCRPLRSRK